ncbi:polyamine ABC transporter substrate-binding protein [Marinomonas sp. C2222]|uniref:Putrescine-binding periplasmic protein n=1 Tax=Marinomonas sargassi TaxID=2984494 RepID=A0ABT2YNK3_9GAMM|nr:polyamine ABC transporter substrate-binding protein [Marinomonas sargassi]MCV2401466.1 polyamine ABC transporter substrate-binding protein [Marinomonas sargassi]
MKYQTLICLCVSALFSPLATAEKVVNVYNWSDYIDPSVLDKFTQQTGIKVNYDVYGSNFELEKKLQAGQSGYDVVMPSNHVFERQLKANFYQKIDKSKLENIGNLDPVLLQQMEKYDPNNQYNVPYAWGTVGIGYNKAMIEERLGTQQIDSWDVFFNPEVVSKLEDCGVTMLDAPADMLSLVNLYRGVYPNSEDEDELEKSIGLLNKIRPYIRSINSSSYIADLANGDICLAIGYNGDVLQSQIQAEEVGIDINYVIPREGAEMWFDVMAIPADAPNPDEALAFIDFILQPETSAAISNYVFYAMPNNAAEPFLDKSIAENTGVYPPQDVKEKLYVQVSGSMDYYRTQSKAWIDFKNSH